MDERGQRRVGRSKKVKKPASGGHKGRSKKNKGKESDNTSGHTTNKKANEGVIRPFTNTAQKRGVYEEGRLKGPKAQGRKRRCRKDKRGTENRAERYKKGSLDIF